MAWWGSGKAACTECLLWTLSLPCVPDALHSLPCHSHIEEGPEEGRQGSDIMPQVTIRCSGGPCAHFLQSCHLMSLSLPDGTGASGSSTMTTISGTVVSMLDTWKQTMERCEHRIMDLSQIWPCSGLAIHIGFLLKSALGNQLEEHLEARSQNEKCSFCAQDSELELRSR